VGNFVGKTVPFVVRVTYGHPTRLSEMAAELVRQRPDLLVCVSNTCRKENGPIPMVFLQVGDPVARGLVRSITRPEGNITGVANIRAELTEKRMELFKEIVPALRRVLVSYDPRQGEEVEALTIARNAAQKLGIALLERPIADPLDIEPGLEELNEGGQDGILIVQAGTNLNIPGRSLEVAFTKAIPTMYFSLFWPQVGALASYGVDAYAQGRQGARRAQIIVSGTPVGDIPVELPERIEFIVNLKTAKRLGLQIPQQVLLRADQVIE
jgi:putative ABC transport system substrate-binding protein